jgi:hypothetical protein
MTEYPVLMSAQQIAEMIGIDANYIRSKMQDGTIPAIDLRVALGDKDEQRSTVLVAQRDTVLALIDKLFANYKGNNPAYKAHAIMKKAVEIIDWDPAEYK